MSPDVIIIGSGIGGSTVAAALAPTGRRILILERGERLADSPEARDAAAIFGRGHFRPKETWLDGNGEGFNPGNYYLAGGNSKFFGAVLIRYRRGRVVVLDRPGLERRTCECYAVVKREYDRLLPVTRAS